MLQLHFVPTSYLYEERGDAPTVVEHLFDHRQGTEFPIRLFLSIAAFHPGS